MAANLREKYQDVLELGEKLAITEGYVEDSDGHLKIGGTAKYAYDKDRLWDKIKSHTGWKDEVQVELKIADDSIYGVYEVVRGDTLWAVSEKALGKGKLYMKVFEANRDQLDDPDKIQVGQMLKIPNRDTA